MTPLILLPVSKPTGQIEGIHTLAACKYVPLKSTYTIIPCRKFTTKTSFDNIDSNHYCLKFQYWSRHGHCGQVPCISLQRRVERSPRQKNYDLMIDVGNSGDIFHHFCYVSFTLTEHHPHFQFKVCALWSTDRLCCPLLDSKKRRRVARYKS